MKVIEHDLYDNVYRVRLFIVICADTNQWDKTLDELGFKGERHEHPKRSAMFYRITPDESTRGNNTSVIFLRNKNFAVLVHELVHFVFCTFDEKGIATRVENDEVFAYYMEYWINTIREEWKGLGKNK